MIFHNFPNPPTPSITWASHPVVNMEPRSVHPAGGLGEHGAGRAELGRIDELHSPPPAPPRAFLSGWRMRAGLGTHHCSRLDPKETNRPTGKLRSKREGGGEEEGSRPRSLTSVTRWWGYPPPQEERRRTRREKLRSQWGAEPAAGCWDLEKQRVGEAERTHYLALLICGAVWCRQWIIVGVLLSRFTQKKKRKTSSDPDLCLPFLTLPRKPRDRGFT